VDRWHERFDSVCLSEDGGGVSGKEIGREYVSRRC